MLKKCSRRSATCFAIACLMFAVVSLWGPKEATTWAEFDSYQTWYVHSNGYSIMALYNFNTGIWSLSSWHYGDTTFDYTLPYYANRAFYLFDLNSYRWEENVYIQDWPM